MLGTYPILYPPLQSEGHVEALVQGKVWRMHPGRREALSLLHIMMRCLLRCLVKAQELALGLRPGALV